ncbi:voltage-gated chloride channel family protein [Flavobacterium sp. CBA20B-1]|uniref:voltage-gated chloride channel family protein n=1 Tax=unclassified Flavobacterium TaxID=196869 RepID=UPI002224B004|nr:MULTISPECIES: voltage-gated chloride channel family protein [unclassified Flavobacterium]WCM41350.1 voltage-gated chloride channel family protein [Flavobacterium sp. CBA20B-1]
MSRNKQKSIGQKWVFQSKIFFRKKPSVFYILKWMLICAVIGVFIGSASAGFLQSLHWATHFRETHIWLIALLPLGGLLIGMLYHYYGKNVEAGNNLLIDTIHQPQEKIPFKTAVFVYLGTIATHFFGGSAGREGTALQMAGAIADQFSKPFQLTPSDRKILIIAAVAGGFGSVFGTPLAGALFAMEFYLIGRIRYHALFPAFLTAILADLVTKLWQTPHTHYHISSIPAISFLNVCYAILAGIAFGICAWIFSKSIHKVSGVFKQQIAYPPLRPFVGGIVVALLVAALGTTKYIGLGIPTIVEAFETQVPAYDFVLKMLLTVITLSAGFKGGEVTPLFFIGATLGNALSLFIPMPSELLTGMGFVAVFAGATNTPIACSIMAMELFGAECGVYVAIACVVSYLLSGHNSIYSRQIIGEAKHPRYAQDEGKRLNEL